MRKPDSKIRKSKKQSKAVLEKNLSTAFFYFILQNILQGTR
jgi:hypothetical protein